MPKPTLFVSLNGPLLIPSSTPNDYLGCGVAEYARPFLTWAKQQFRVQVLTDENLRHVHYLAEHLDLPANTMTPRGFEVSKIEAMHPDDDFYWVDSELIPSEIAWLGQHQILHRLLTVDPTVGVTPKLRDSLESLVRTNR